MRLSMHLFFCLLLHISTKSIIKLNGIFWLYYNDRIIDFINIILLLFSLIYLFFWKLFYKGLTRIKLLIKIFLLLFWHVILEKNPMFHVKQLWVVKILKFEREISMSENIHIRKFLYGIKNNFSSVEHDSGQNIKIFCREKIFSILSQTV